MTQEQKTPDFLRSFGRRRARKLTPRKEELQSGLLPKLRINLPETGKIDLVSLFPKACTAFALEIGFGGGEHVAAQAAHNPSIGFIGCEPFVDGVMKLVTDIAEQGQENIRIFDEDARLLLEKLPAASLSRAYILFPDPWPKARHHKRRVVNPETLALLAHVLKPGAELRLASDHFGYVEWMLEHLLADPNFRWLAKGPEDFEQAPEDWIKTRYQQKAENQDIPITFLRFERL